MTENECYNTMQNAVNSQVRFSNNLSTDEYQKRYNAQYNSGKSTSNKVLAPVYQEAHTKSNQQASYYKTQVRDPAINAANQSITNNPAKDWKTETDNIQNGMAQFGSTNNLSTKLDDIGDKLASMKKTAETAGGLK